MCPLGDMTRTMEAGSQSSPARSSAKMQLPLDSAGLCPGVMSSVRLVSSIDRVCSGCGHRRALCLGSGWRLGLSRWPLRAPVFPLPLQPPAPALFLPHSELLQPCPGGGRSWQLGLWWGTQDTGCRSNAEIRVLSAPISTGAPHSQRHCKGLLSLKGH